MLTDIATPVIGGLISLLLVIIGFFLTRLIKQVDKSSDSIDNLSEVVGKLNVTIEKIEKESIIRHDQIKAVLAEHHNEIEMVRQRTHDLSNYVTAIKLQGELKNGWVFSKPWKLASINKEGEREDS